MSERCNIALKVAQDAQAEAASFTIPPRSFQRATIGEVYAIDAAAAVEVDDALGFSLGPLGRVLQVCITDVGGHLYDKPAIRAVAEQRRKTIYQADSSAAPMLPSNISHDVLSLQDNTKRPVVTVRIPVDVDNCLNRADITLDVANVKRVTYASADQAIRKRSTLLRQLQAMTDKLHRQRLARVDASVGSQAVEDEKNVDSPAKKLVSEAMIAANAALAQFAIRHDIPCIFRSVNIPASYNVTGNSALQQYFGKPTTRVTYTDYSVAHLALGHSAYLQGTSPLRRLVDFVNQCNIVAFLEGRAYPYSHKSIAGIACSLNTKELTKAAEQPMVTNLVEQMSTGRISASQLASILFSSSHTEQATLAKKKVLEYLVKNQYQARTIIDSGVTSGQLVARARPTAGDIPAVTLYGSSGQEATLKPHGSRDPANSGRMVQIVSQMAGLEVPTSSCFIDYSEQRVLRNPQRYMGQLHRRHDLGYQTTASQQSDGRYSATAYVHIGGELQQWMASGSTDSEARSNAVRQLIVDMNYIRRPPLFVQSFESFMKLDGAFSPERCLRRIAAYHRLPQPVFLPARQKYADYCYYAAHMRSPDYSRQLTAVERDPYEARQRAAYRLLRGVISDLRKMGRL